SLAALPIVTWVLENHDVTRLVTRFGEREARAAALLLLALPGPAFIYQGQELGLEEVDLPDESRQDPIFRRSHGEPPGRGGCRRADPGRRRGRGERGARRGAASGRRGVGAALMSQASGVRSTRGSRQTSPSSRLRDENSLTTAPSGPAWNQCHVSGTIVCWSPG